MILVGGIKNVQLYLRKDFSMTIVDVDFLKKAKNLFYFIKIFKLHY
jgi:hypothetical protein